MKQRFPELFLRRVLLTVYGRRLQQTAFANTGCIIPQKPGDRFVELDSTGPGLYDHCNPSFHITSKTK
jgi:hypothetical protein